MSTCTIIIKVKDYFPKIDSIPYQNYICLFTSGENEGQVPLISQENESYQHQIKNVVSDIKYKVHVLDYNDMSLIGMCEMAISYSIISQINPPNGFIQEQQKKLLMDLKTKRKLFGTVLNMGDIYLNIYSEIYLSERVNTSIQSSQKSTTTRKKNLISINNSELRRKFDGSPRTVQKKKLLMEMNSDRQILMNLNKNNHLNISNLEKQKNYSSNNNKEEKNKNIVKPNSSFNYREVPKENKNGLVKINKNKKNNIVKNKTKQNVIPKKSIDKKLNNYNTEKESNLTHNNLLNRFKTESNKNKNNSKKKPNKIIQNMNTDNNEKILKGGVNYFNNPPNKNLLMNNISPKLSNENYNENEDLQFNNNTGNKITTIESLENIDFSGKKYITKAKTKKNNSHSNINSNINNTLFSTNSTEQEINDIDKIILEKGTEITNDFNTQSKNTKSNTNDSDIDYVNKSQLDIRNNFLKLIDFYSLLSSKILKLNKKNMNLNKKSIIYKEKLFTELQKNNVLTQKKTTAEIENFNNVNNHGALNEKFLRAIIKLKKSEFKIYQNIFNSFYYEYDILKFKEYEKNKKLDEGVKIELLLVVFKNLLKNYGNISQIYMGNITKRNSLKNCLNKYGLKEKLEGGESNMDIIQSSTKSNTENKNLLENKENKNDIDKFKVIKEEDEEKEDEIDEEEDKYNIMNNDNNQISYNNSNTKENMYNSNEKVRSNIKSNNKAKNEPNVLFANEDKINNDNKKILDNIKDNNNLHDINKLDNANNVISNKNNIIDEINNLIRESKNGFEKNEEEDNQIEKRLDNNNTPNTNKDIKDIKDMNNSGNKKENNIEDKNNRNVDIKNENITDNKNENNLSKKIELNDIVNDSLNNDDEEKENKEQNENIKEINDIKENNKLKNKQKEIIDNENIEEIEEKNNKMNKLEKNIDNKKNINTINEIITNNIDSEKDEIKSIRNEKNINNNNININNNINNEVYIKKTRIKEEKRNESDKKNKEEKITNSNNEVKNEVKNEIKEENNRNIYRRKNRIRKKEEMYDEEDLKIQKLLIEEFPKKCKEENRFIRITKHEYAFGEEKIKVVYEDNDVILKLDEGDYKLQEFIEILNEGKEEGGGEEEDEDVERVERGSDEKRKIAYEKKEKEVEKEVEEEIEKELDNRKEISDKKSSNKKKTISESSEKKGKKKRRKKKISEENSQDEEENEENSDNENDNENDNDNEVEKEKEKEKEKEEDKNKYRYRYNYSYNRKERYENLFSDQKDEENDNIKEVIKEEKQNLDNNNENQNEEINYSDNKNRKYVMKRRKDYLLKK